MGNDTINDKKVVEILWTGGYDSTFRVVMLSRFDIVIQPYYISDKRESEKYELEAIKKITDILTADSNTKCEFRPICIIDVSQRKEIPEITDTYRRILKTDFIGRQYDFLACFATEHKGIELSVHEDDKAILLINKYGKLNKVTDDTYGDYYVLDEQNTRKDIYTLFKDFHFPLVYYTKLQMKDYYIKNGYKDVMDLTWFCYTPVNGKPCGTCNPCCYTIEEGMSERFDKKALGRYKRKCFKKKIKNLPLIRLAAGKKK